MFLQEQTTTEAQLDSESVPVVFLYSEVDDSEEKS